MGSTEADTSRALDPNRVGTLVTLGNLRKPFGRLLSMVTACLDCLPGPVLVQKGHTTFAEPRVISVEFLDPDDFENAMASAQLVISHAGAGSIMSAIQMGKVPLVQARRSDLGEHLDDHQVELADALAQSGRVIRVESEQQLREAVAGAPRRAPPIEDGGQMTRLIRDKLAEIERSLPDR